MTKEDIPSEGKLSPKPYARLLTMMGDQLIKNEKIALIELIKNSYDADADWVQIRFKEFEVDGNNLIHDENSVIEIEDNGIGMSFEVIRNAWMNPASPKKLLEKESGNKRSEFKNRVIQGEKGIGRYATFKIGSYVEIFTSYFKDSSEIRLLSDLSKYDKELIQEKEKDKKDPLYLDQIEFEYEINRESEIFDGAELNFKKNVIKRDDHGTLIRIKNLKGSWSLSKIEKIVKDIRKIQSPFNLEDPKDFKIDLVLNGKSQIATEKADEDIREIFLKAPVRATKGKFTGKEIRFVLNGDKEAVFDLNRLSSAKEFKDRFLNDGKVQRKPDCGPFRFEFFVFDRRGRKKVPEKYWLNRADKEFVKEHRIYLSRDGIRVYPYGDPDDDWLEIDIKRGTARAGDYLSNDQTVGRIEITQENNPQLKDKTNREGLLEIGSAFEDFKVTIRAILNLLKVEFDKYKFSLDQQEAQRITKEKIVKNDFLKLEDHLKQNEDDKGKKLLKNLKNRYDQEKDFLVERAEISEDLAAVGLSVETASHDLMLMMGKVNKSLKFSIDGLNGERPDYEEIITELKETKEQLSLIEDLVKGIQPLFRSSKRRSKKYEIKEIINKVRKYFLQDLEETNINLTLKEKSGSLKVKSNEAVLLQTFINLFDNSIYWLDTTDNEDKEILIGTDAENNEVIFSDSGPGVEKDNIPYIFEHFFSTKGVGRGLGLYICKQLLERNDFSIEYLSNKPVLSGANFLITF